MTYEEFYMEQARLAEKLKKEKQVVKLLLLEKSGMTATELYINYRKKIPVEVRKKTLAALDEYFHHNKPVQYLLGYTYFYGLKLLVRPGVLIPRPETELLVEKVLENIVGRKTPRILDLGTGSGAIALAIKKNRGDALLTATDISALALGVARKNAAMHGLDVEFIESNLFASIPGKYDVLVSNPPYVSRDENIDPLVSENEPEEALYAGEGGLSFYREILSRAWEVLFDSNLIALEIPENKDEELSAIVKNYFPESEFAILKDLNNLSRILIIRNDWRI